MAQIRINKAQWEAVADSDKEAIIQGLRSTSALKIGDTIISDEDTPALTEDTLLEPMWNPLKGICKAACDVAATAAVAWCTANTVGVGLVACIALAEAARGECRNRC